MDVRRGNVLPAMVMRKPRFEVLVFFGPFAIFRRLVLVAFDSFCCACVYVR